MLYLGISVWPHPFDGEAAGQTADGFDFNGVMIKESIKIAPFPTQENPEFYGVILRITINNEKGKHAPYTIDVEVSGQFEIVSDKIEKEKQEEFVIVNGCAVLYSAIRDQVMAISSRFQNGALVLPTVNFLDKINKKTEQPEIKKSTRKRTVKES